MTMVNDPGHFNPTPPRKSYNPFECDDEALDTLGMESENVYSKEDHIGFDLKEFEGSAKSLTFLMGNDDSLWEESIASANDHTSSFEKDVMECELPEPIISKDIGVDEGMHTLESEDLSSVDDSQKITDPKVDLEDQASFPVDWATMTVESAPGGLVDDCHVAKMDPSYDAFKKGEPDSVSKDGNDNSFDELDSIVVQEPVTGVTLSKLLTLQQETKVNPEETQNEEQTLLNSDNNITFGFSSASTHADPINQEDNPQSAEPAISRITPQTTPRHEQPTSSNSVSTAVPHFSSSITFSGSVTYSGNSSIRSESSTGSTRSFAFPVLQNEWNSSPVRMAKADRRHKKNKRWMQSLVCCRF